MHWLQACEAVIDVEVLTPVLVWSGRTSTVGLDSFISKRRSGNRFLLAGEDCVETASRHLLSSHHTGDLVSLAQELPREVKRLLDSGLCEAEIDAEAVVTPNVGEVVLIGWEYPPETTIKGLIRTAVIVGLLAEEFKGPNAPRVLNDLRRSVYITSTRDAKRAFRNLEQRLLGRRLPVTNFVYDAFQRVNVVLDDSEHNGMVLDSFEVRGKGGKTVAKLNVVAIKPGSRFKYKLVVTKLSRRVPRKASGGPVGMRHQLDELDSKIASCKRIIDSIQLYSKLVIESEASKYRELEMHELSKFINNLKERVEKLGEGYSLLKIGMKAGHDSKTVTPLLKFPQVSGIPIGYRNDLKNVYSNLSRSLSRIYHKVWDDRTLTLSASSGEPVDWVALKVTLIR